MWLINFINVWEVPFWFLSILILIFGFRSRTDFFSYAWSKTKNWAKSSHYAWISSKIDITILTILDYLKQIGKKAPVKKLDKWVLYELNRTSIIRREIILKLGFLRCHDVKAKHLHLVLLRVMNGFFWIIASVWHNDWMKYRNTIRNWIVTKKS